MKENYLPVHVFLHTFMVLHYILGSNWSLHIIIGINYNCIICLFYSVNNSADYKPECMLQHQRCIIQEPCREKVKPEHD